MEERRGERRSHQHNVKAMKSINSKEHSSTDVEHDNGPFTTDTLRN